MQKIIFLIDMNAFFISCEMTRRPHLLGQPAAVGGDPKKRTGIILAANYEARAKGVRTAMVLHEALRLCPELILVPPDHHFYGQKSKEVMTLLSGYTPILEQNSIDEAWLDMSGCGALFGEPFEAATRMMEEIKHTLNLWCSIGISENKFLAKMASEMKKPLGITELWKADVKEKLWPLPVRAMYGVGAKTAEKFHLMGIQTIGDLAKANADLLIGAFGKHGYVLHQRANGIDNEPVTPRTAESIKSISRESTLPDNIVDINEAKSILLRLADDVAMSARSHQKRGHTVQITLKYADFVTMTRQTSVPATNTTKEIYQAGCRLLEKNWSKARPVRLIGIGLSGFEDASVQLSLFDEMTMDHRVDSAIDKIRRKHGTDAITLGTLIKKNAPKKC